MTDGTNRKTDRMERGVKKIINKIDKSKNPGNHLSGDLGWRIFLSIKPCHLGGFAHKILYYLNLIFQF